MRYIIHISTDNDSFSYPNTKAELLHVLSRAVDVIETNAVSRSNLLDSNGNTCGKLWSEDVFIRDAARMIAGLVD